MVGGSLRHLLDYFVSFKENLVKNYVIQILNGLKILHTISIHGDLKNSNLFVDELGVLKLSDLGCIKKSLEPELLDQPPKGSFRFAAPELARGDELV